MRYIPFKMAVDGKEIVGFADTLPQKRMFNHQIKGGGNAIKSPVFTVAGKTEYDIFLTQFHKAHLEFLRSWDKKLDVRIDFKEKSFIISGMFPIEINGREVKFSIDWLKEI